MTDSEGPGQWEINVSVMQISVVNGFREVVLKAPEDFYGDKRATGFRKFRTEKAKILELIS